MPSSENDRITVSFDSTKCIHARRCVLGLPEVFRAGAKGAWIFPEAAAVEEVVRVVDLCPSGALSYHRADGGAEEPLPRVNTARLWENGPYETRGDIRIPGEEPRKRAVLCRCGESKNKPFCDGSHVAAGFAAPCEVPSQENAKTLEARDGPLTIQPQKNGPLMVSGNLEIICGSGRRVSTGTKFALCRCGHSKNKPFCDGSHKAAGFEAP